MSSLNKVMLIGRLGSDPELKYTQTGIPVCSLSVATDESFTDRQGQRQQKTEWHRVSVWKRQAEACNTHLAKGSLVFVEGKLETRQWQDQQGQKRHTTEIQAQRVQFLDRKGGQPDSAKSRQSQQPQQDYVNPDGTPYQPPQGEGYGSDDVQF